MRAVLNFPQIDNQKMETVKKLIDYIAENGNSDCSRKLQELSEITGKEHDSIEFAEYWGWTDLDALAEKILTAEPPCVRDLTPEEVEELVSIIQNSLMIGEDSKAEYYMELLHKSLPLTNVIGYIMSGDDAAEIAGRMINASKSSVIYL